MSQRTHKTYIETVSIKENPRKPSQMHIEMFESIKTMPDSLDTFSIINRQKV